MVGALVHALRVVGTPVPDDRGDWKVGEYTMIIEVDEQVVMDLPTQAALHESRAPSVVLSPVTRPAETGRGENPARM